jgi:hypothetical protein
VEGSCEHDNELSGSIKFGKFFSSCTTGGFTRRVQVHGDSQSVCKSVCPICRYKGNATVILNIFTPFFYTYGFIITSVRPSLCQLENCL